MSWLDLQFIHQAADPDRLQRLLPHGLVPDTWNGKAWVAIVPFRMCHVAPRGLPTVPFFSHFLELNVRTYVRPVSGGPHGVYFFSLDCNHRTTVVMARAIYGLNYFHARLTQKGRVYEAHRTDSRAAPAVFRCDYGPASRDIVQAEPGTLAHFFTERYSLYSWHGRRGLLHGEVHHAPWPLYPAKIHGLDTNLLEGHHLAETLLPGEEPHTLYSPGVDVVAWWPKALGTN